MKLLKVGVVALLMALTVSAGAVQAQDTGGQRPKAPKPCYDPAGSRACAPGPSVDVLTLGSKLRAKTTRVLRLKTPIRKAVR